MLGPQVPRAARDGPPSGCHQWLMPRNSSFLEGLPIPPRGNVDASSSCLDSRVCNLWFSFWM
jgi:hypothetical protein